MQNLAINRPNLIGLYAVTITVAESTVLVHGIACWLHFRGSDCMQVYGDGIPDKAKCP